MHLLILATVVLAVACGLLWHNRPASEREVKRDNDYYDEGISAVLGIKKQKVRTSKDLPPLEQSALGVSNGRQALLWPQRPNGKSGRTQ